MKILLGFTLTLLVANISFANKLSCHPKVLENIKFHADKVLELINSKQTEVSGVLQELIDKKLIEQKHEEVSRLELLFKDQDNNWDFSSAELSHLEYLKGHSYAEFLSELFSLDFEKIASKLETVLPSEVSIVRSYHFKNRKEKNHKLIKTFAYYTGLYFGKQPFYLTTRMLSMAHSQSSNMACSTSYKIFKELNAKNLSAGLMIDEKFQTNLCNELTQYLKKKDIRYKMKSKSFLDSLPTNVDAFHHTCEIFGSLKDFNMDNIKLSRSLVMMYLAI